MTSILYIPADGDPHGLLAGGPCGQSPPYLDRWRCVSRECSTLTHEEGGEVLYRPTRCPACKREGYLTSAPPALALVWNGEVLDLGVARLEWHTARVVFADLDSHKPYRCSVEIRVRHGLGASGLEVYAVAVRVDGWTRERFVSIDIPTDIPPDLREPWALATVAADILGGSVVVIDND